MGYCEALYKVLQGRHHSVRMNHCAKGNAEAMEWKRKPERKKEFTASCLVCSAGKAF